MKRVVLRPFLPYARAAIASAALCLPAIQASALQYPGGHTTSGNTVDMLSCCPGEDTSTQARFVWTTRPGVPCRFMYKKAGEPGERSVAPTSVQHRNESWPTAFCVYPRSGAPTNYVDYARHAVELSGLSPGTEYEYRVMAGGGCSPTQRFKTAGSSGSWNFIWMSDVHADRGSHSKMESVSTLVSNAKGMAGQAGLELVVFSGDYVKYGQRYDNWQEWNGSPALTGYMAAVCHGNHDYYGFPKARVGGTTRLRDGWFLEMRNNPANGADGIGGSYWFMRDSVLFVSIDSMAGEAATDSGYMNPTVVGEALKRQTSWFDLVVTEQKAKKSFRWLVVFQHYPCFTYEKKDDGAPVGFKYGDGGYSKWRPLFDKHKVDFVLGSDNHNYCRSRQIRSGRVDPEGVVYLTSPEIPGYLSTPRVVAAESLYTRGLTTSGAPDNAAIEALMAAAQDGNSANGAVLFAVTPQAMTMKLIGKSGSDVYDMVSVKPKDRGFKYTPACAARTTRISYLEK